MAILPALASGGRLAPERARYVPSEEIASRLGEVPGGTARSQRVLPVTVRTSRSRFFPTEMAYADRSGVNVAIPGTFWTTGRLRRSDPVAGSHSQNKVRQAEMV